MKLPVIRHITPCLLPNDIIGVQPMTEPLCVGGLEWTIRCYREGLEPIYEQGARRHSFIDGWQRYYGTKWISEYLYWFLKIKGL